MGKIRTSVIKNSAKDIDEAMPERASKDFRENQKLLKELNLTSSSKVRNKIAGYLVRVERKKEN